MFDTRESFRDTSCTDIHAVNKIRLSDTISSGKVAVPGYTLKRNDRNRDGGGVSLYILNTINYERLFDLESESLEFIGIKVIKPKANLVPRAFPSKNGWGGKRPWHRLVTCLLVHPKILGVINWRHVKS